MRLAEHEEEWVWLIFSKLVGTGGGKGAARNSDVPKFSVAYPWRTENSII